MNFNQRFACAGFLVIALQVLSSPVDFRPTVVVALMSIAFFQAALAFGLCRTTEKS